MGKTGIAAKVPPELRREVEDIARMERRSVSSIVQMALESFIEHYKTIHPQFHADILEALDGVKRGEVEPYTYG